MATTPKIGILYTGGTIGMAPTAQGLAPSANLAALAAPYLLDCQVEWHIYTPLIDSSAVNLHHWQDWLTWVAEHLDAYDGLLILHGTDTMAYTANILALAQPNLTKPIVLTGAQWPLQQAHSDAPLNLQTALAALTLPGFHQVAIAFHGQLWRAVGSSKVSTESIDGFATPHFPSLGKWQPENKWSHLKLHTLPAPDDQMQKQPNTSSIIQENVRIHSFVFTPGANIDMITTVLTQQPADGVVLQTYGHGNVPTHPGLMKAIQAATHQARPYSTSVKCHRDALRPCMLKAMLYWVLASSMGVNAIWKRQQPY